MKKAKESARRGTNEDQVKVSFSGAEGEGFLHRGEEHIVCSRDKRHKIYGGMYHSKDEGGAPVCRDCRPFDVVSAG